MMVLRGHSVYTATPFGTPWGKDADSDEAARL